MLTQLFLFLYFILAFIVLSLVSIALPRINKLNKNRPFYIYIGFYILNSILLNYFIKFHPISTLFLNLVILVLSHFIGSKFRLMGLTGQICSGKSTVANYLETNYNAVMIDADKLNREVLQLDAVKKEIKRKFGDDVFDQNEELDRVKLRKIVFENPSKIQQLQRITHGRVFKLMLIRILQAKLFSKSNFVFLENALLLRFKIFKYLCFPILAVCTSHKAEIIGRVMARDKCDRETAERVLESQMSKEEFVKQSDYVILNDESKDQLQLQVDKFMSQLC